MNAHHLEATLTEDGDLTLRRLPFPAGAEVEVIIMERRKPSMDDAVNPMRGAILRYDDPFGPACPPEDWDAIR
jgi:hypothetical protein